ncbi:MAG: ABC-type transport auxiliary lipoprotein family protein [Pseudomonadota bacterium]|uniref:ABC-type transport auxiliary lipoprotein family protein n=1 Tax=Methylophaga TaxID=40222 RepID=UPI0024E1EA99|nr:MULTISPECIES: ABC-type transport auxiliary lipoprotein family protein [Methylophaga]MEC9412533.1 ABC-type transport auxiliary lipoprotein family protein [Pseudomonadota bacterium]
MTLYSRLFFSVFILSTSLLLSSCFSWGGGEKEVDMTPRYYVLDVERPDVAADFPSNRVLRLNPVRVVPHFKSKTLIFRVGENEYKAVDPHQFLVDPEVMFTNILKRWLQKSGQFSKVVTDDSVPADFTMDAAVTAFYGEKRPAYSPQSVIEMQFFMTAADNPEKLLFQTGLRVDVDIEQATPSNVVTGWKQGTEELLTTLEQDLSAYFSKVDAR